MVYESPGYVTTRLICLLINEALHVLEEGVASPEDIDDAMSMGYSFEHGPLRWRTDSDSIRCWPLLIACSANTEN